MKGDEKGKIFGEPDTTSGRKPDGETSKERPVKKGIRRSEEAHEGTPKESQRVGHHEAKWEAQGD